MANLDSNNYAEHGYHRERPKEIFVRFENSRTGEKHTVVLPGNGYVPQPGSTFSNGIAEGTVIRSWEA